MTKANKSYKVIIDSNVWISFLIGKDLSGLQNFIESKTFIILTCEEQLIELYEVFERPKLRKYFDKDQIIEFFELFEESSKSISLSTKTNLCRDPKDNYLVSLAIDSQADYLVTGDNDLLVLTTINNTIVIKYSDFNALFHSL